MPTFRKKILAREDLHQWRRSIDPSVHPVVLTCGCFDLLHPGHAINLEKMRNLGRSLFVGVNSDRSVALIKPGRPIMDQDARAVMLASLESVTWVSIVEDPADLIYQIKPDIFTKGSDWAFETLPLSEQQALKSTGAAYQLIPRAPGNTTDIIAKILKNQRHSC